MLLGLACSNGGHVCACVCVCVCVLGGGGGWGAILHCLSAPTCTHKARDLLRKSMHACLPHEALDTNSRLRLLQLLAHVNARMLHCADVSCATKMTV